MLEYLVSLTATDDMSTPTDKIDLLHDRLEIAGGERMNTSIVGWQREGYIFKIWLDADSPQSALAAAIEIMDRTIEAPLSMSDWRITKCQS